MWDILRWFLITVNPTPRKMWELSESWRRQESSTFIASRGNCYFGCSLYYQLLFWDCVALDTDLLKICILYSQTVFLGGTRGCDCIKRARHRSGVRSRWRPQSHCVVASRRWNFAARKNPHSRRKTQHPKCHSQGRRSLCVRSAKYRRHYICQCNSLCSR